jgi:lactoylglutathione lyase
MLRRIILLTVLFNLGNCATLYGQLDPSPANDAGVQYLGHAAISVSDIDKSINFYSHQLGLTEVFRMTRPDGVLWIVYFRVNNNNFVELFPGAEKRPDVPTKQAGFDHLGFFVKDLQATLHIIQDRGYPLPADAFKEAAKVRADGTMMYFIKDPDGNRIELSQIPPDSKQAKSRR